MTIFIEEPSFAVAEKRLTRDGGLVESERVCPFGFRKSISCGCSNPIRVRIGTPLNEDACQGRLFPPDPFIPPLGTTCH